MRTYNCYKLATITIIGIVIFSMTSITYAEFNFAEFIINFEKKETQSALTGIINNWTIKRGNAEFVFDKGEMTIFDFTAGKPLALVFTGTGRFNYIPPNEVERQQLRKFAKCDTLECSFESVSLFLTIQLENFPDTISFQRTNSNKNALNLLHESSKRALRHLGIYIPNSLLRDAFYKEPGDYLFAYFETKKHGNLAFIEDPTAEDQYCLYKTRLSYGAPSFNVWGGYTPDNLLVSQRAVIPIDITHYDMDSRIEGSGKMSVNCWIKFRPLLLNTKLIYFRWMYKNEMIFAIDSRGDSLTIIHGKDEPGFGLILKNPLEVGQEDSIRLSYKCNSLENAWGIYYPVSLTCWYPQNIIGDRATYKMRFDIPDNYELVTCGKNTESEKSGGRQITNWVENRQVSYVSFNIGYFENRQIIADSIVPPVTVYRSKAIPHQEYALMLSYFGVNSNSDMLGVVGADVVNSAAFYTSIFGPMPFEDIKVTELPAYFGQGSPGLVHLSFANYLMSDRMQGSDIRFRAHETAHQWWGNMVDNESYRDVWIIEGLAEYCSFWFYQMSSKNTKACDEILKDWRQRIYSTAKNSGSISLGKRLMSSQSDDYEVLVYMKGAYIFHMIRYLLYDNKNNSDNAFASFLRELIARYSNRPITAASLQKTLEKYTGEDMSWFFNQWVYGTHLPRISFSYEYRKKNSAEFEVVCRVISENLPSGFKMYYPLTVTFDKNRQVQLGILVDKNDQIIKLPILPYEPKKIIFNSNDAVLAEISHDNWR